MPAPKRRKESRWVTLAWTLNIIGLGAIALVLVAYLALQPVFAAPQAQQPIYTATLPQPIHRILYRYICQRSRQTRAPR
jgi:hypothetical protein